MEDLKIPEFAKELIPGLINIGIALLTLLIGWIIARLVSAAIVRLLNVMNFDSITEKIRMSEFLGKANVKIQPSAIIGKFVFWILMLIAFVMTCDKLGLNAISEKISDLIDYLPTLFTAIIIFLIGIYLATFIRDLIRGATASLGLSAGKIVGNLVFYLLVVMVALTALDQAGVDTKVITSNMLIIMGSVLLAAAISYGFASRDVLSNILAGYAGRSTFAKGQIIEIDGIQGEIIDITSTSVILQTGSEKVVIPSHDLITNKVKILK